MTTEYPKRTIRSFAKREYRLTDRQERGITLGFQSFGLKPNNEMFQFEKIFNNAHPVILEIGFGMGHSLRIQAKNNPHYNYLGIEVHRPGIGSLLAYCLDDPLDNVRVIENDAIEIVEKYIANGSLAGVQIYFPDPWPKKRHHKRRLIQVPFVGLLVKKLQPGSFIHLATDWAPYAEQMLEVLSQIPTLSNTASDFWLNDGRRPLTKFEQRGQALGHGVWDLLFLSV